MGRGPCSHESYFISGAQGFGLSEGNSDLTAMGEGRFAPGGVFDHGTYEEDGPGTWEEQPTRLGVLWGESPLSSIARFGRLAYPMRMKVTTYVLLGWRRHGCLAVLNRNGGSDLGGKQTWRPERKGMTAVSKYWAAQKSQSGSYR